MPRIKQTTIFTYDELSPEAQSRARDWYRTTDTGDNFYAEAPTDDFKEVAKACGFQIGGRNPNNRGDKGIYWEGFSHQGSGASFTGSWSAACVDVRAELADRPAVVDGTLYESNLRLREVLEGFAELAKDEPTGYGNVTASNRGHSMACDYDIDDESELSRADTEERADTFKELCLDLADWFYRALEAEYEYVNSDDVVAETLRANEYEFTADGVRS